MELYLLLAAAAGIVFLATALVNPLAAFVALIGVYVSPVFLHVGRFQWVLYSLAGSLMLLIALVLRKGRLYIPRDKAVLAAFFYLVLNTLIGVLAFGNSMWETLGEIFPWFELLAFLLLTLLLFKDKRQMWWVMVVLLVLAITKGVYELYLYFSGKLMSLQVPFLETSNVGLEYSGLVLPLLFDYNLAYILPFVLGIFIYLKRVPFRLKILLELGLMVIVLVLLLSFSRSMLLAAAVSGIVLFGLSKGRERMTFFKFGLVAAFLGLLSVVLLGFSGIFKELNVIDLFRYRFLEYTVEQAFNPENEYQQLRVAEIKSALKDLSKSPVIGLGSGHVVKTNVNFRGTDEDVVLHNFVFGFVVKYGVVGVIFLSIFGFKLARFIQKYRLVAESGFDVFLLNASIAALSWQITVLLFEPIFLAFHIPAFIGTSLGLLMVNYKLNRRAVYARCTERTTVEGSC